MLETKDTSTLMTFNKAFRKMVASMLVTTIFIAVIVFIPVGRLDWMLGWIFVAAWSLPKLVFTFILRWYDPELLVERMTRHQNTQKYERVIIPLYYILSLGTILFAVLDGGRFHWSAQVPTVVIILSYIINLSGSLLAYWAVSANPFFSSESRLQIDRNQRVTRSGPYRFVRHPGYLASILLWPVYGLMLGSWWAFIPGLLAAMMMLIRTIYEDRMLRTELPGYAEYARQVRYRLFPGIW